MNLKFSWLNSRKSLIISSFIDFLLFSYFFFSIFISSISNKPTLLNLTLLNSLIWIICSYIIGRYSNFRRAKFSIFLFQFLKTFLIICLSLLINQVLFRLFWNWNYMNFESFSSISLINSSRFLFDRDSLPAIALGTNSSSMSAIANDYGYEKIFSREISSLGSLNDIFIPITTSGNSVNLIHAAKEAQRKNLKVVALTGESGGKLASICNCIKVPSSKVPRIQECHILIGHILCQIVEEELFK